MDTSVYLKAVLDNCKCNDKFSNENCQIQKHSEHRFCKALAVKSCRDSVASLAEAFRKAENAKEPACFEQDPGYNISQVEEASCKGINRRQYNYLIIT